MDKQQILPVDVKNYYVVAIMNCNVCHKNHDYTTTFLFKGNSIEYPYEGYCNGQLIKMKVEYVTATT